MAADQDIQDRFLVSFTPQDCRPRVADAAWYLGGAGYRPTPGIRRRIEKTLNLAEGLMAPAAALAVLPVPKADRGGARLTGDRGLPGSLAGEWCQAEYVIACVATLGPGLEARCRALSPSEPLGAIVLDAVGVASLDKLAEIVGREIERQARRRGLYGGARISPGLQQADLRLQTVLFELVDSGALGVELTADLIMKPFKSISEFRVLGSRPPTGATAPKCMDCDLVACGFRRQAPKEAIMIDNGRPDAPQVKKGHTNG
jgi:hypothetical protein